MSNFHLYTAIDKNTEQPVNKIVCLRSEKSNPDKKLYKIIGYIKKEKQSEFSESKIYETKIAISEVNGNSKLILSFNKLIESYIEVKIKI